ncbi:hypothetical protein GCM10023206_16330 [Acinetobacter puyangensis]|uniref:MoxR-like ATPase n=1 Tax=Acinetobacter puyangensis TaxID=1096779 RepID=A0A240E5R7_9GAMM|nr:hypothetical protein [Acinetobacter puyangensis]SNX44104.1 MoxR-like ATPase [Acinetobacter puyangensis]
MGKEIEDRNKVKFDTELLDNAKKHADLDKDILQKKETLNSLNIEYDSLSKKHLTLKKYDQVIKDLEDAETKYRYEFERQLTIEKETHRLTKLYSEAEDNLRLKLFELKPFVETINGNNISTIKKVEMDISIQSHVTDPTNTNIPFNIINRIEQSLRVKGRSISPIEIINLIITIQQSFLCFLAGLPGGGKTSLVRLLADVNGISSKRFLEIPVARGWTGQKDLIGYFNPISNRFQTSSTGMYNFISALDKESDNNINSALALILLDEANLSPIEHYWSSFMGISDDIRTKKSIRLGENLFTIPENLRFIATINYDNTTEFLSHRILDRAPVILLDGNQIIPSMINDEFQSLEKIIPMPISYNSMEQYFGTVDQIPDLTDKEQRIFDQIKSTLEDKTFEYGKSIQISNRKVIAIHQYCNKARPLMRTYSDDNDVLALDYAILQLILPQIRGNGKNFSNRLLKLKDVLNSHELNKSVECLETIINNGNADLNTYDFFCW